MASMISLIKVSDSDDPIVTMFKVISDDLLLSFEQNTFVFSNIKFKSMYIF